jgi:hypothetical protein
VGGALCKACVFVFILFDITVAPAEALPDVDDVYPVIVVALALAFLNTLPKEVVILPNESLTLDEF